MDLEPKDVTPNRRQRPGYYDRHQHRRPWTVQDVVIAVSAVAFIAWLYVVFGGRPM